jgi:hypothetical protein
MADADDGMDRATIERNLAQVERDMRAASEDIAHQRETLRAARGGYDGGCALDWHFRTHPPSTQLVARSA